MDVVISQLAKGKIITIRIVSVNQTKGKNQNQAINICRIQSLQSLGIKSLRLAETEGWRVAVAEDNRKYLFCFKGVSPMSDIWPGSEENIIFKHKRQIAKKISPNFP